VLIPASSNSQPGKTQYNWRPEDPRFITYREGFGNHGIQGIAQDHEGFMWFGSDNGLYRFDGITFKKFVHDDTDSNSLPADKCYVRFVDSRGLLWIECNGLTCYNTETERFQNYNPGDTLFKELMTGMAEDKNHDLWITQHGKYSLVKYVRNSDKFRVFSFPDSLTKSKLSPRGLVFDSTGKIYVAVSYKGIMVFNPATEKYERLIGCKNSRTAKLKFGWTVE